MKKTCITNLAAFALVGVQTLTAHAAAPQSAEEAIRFMSGRAIAKVQASQWKKLYEASKPEFLVEFRDESPTESEDNAQPMSERLARKKSAFDAVKSRVLSRFRTGDIETRTGYSHLPMLHVRANSKDALLNLMELGEVTRIHAITQHRTQLTQSLSQIAQPPVIAAGHNGAGTSVVVIDTGLDYSRAAFGNCTAPGVPAATCRVPVAFDIAPNDNALDAHGHGTNVAGIVAGVAPGAKLIGLDVFNGATANTNDIVTAINWAIANRAAHNIVAMNLSLGDGTLNTTECSGSYAQVPFAQARSVGIVPVVASGNNAFKNGVSSPACAPSALTVGAVYDANLGGVSWSACTDLSSAVNQVICFSNSGPQLDLLAPGAYITAAGISMGGTSQAAPHVAGAIAILRGISVAPDLPVDQLISNLATTGVSITDPKNGVVRPRIHVADAVTRTMATAFAAPAQVYSGFSIYSEKPFAADVNGDGRADLVTFSGGTTADVYVALSNGTGFGSPQKWHDWFAPNGEKPFVADVNGDGKSDLITFVGGDSGDVYVSLSTGSGFAPSQKVHDWFAPGAEIPFVADVNGDGKADLVTFVQGTSGDVWVSFSTGTGFSASQKLKTGFALQGEKPFVADFNGDRKADLITFVGGNSGKVYVSLSTGSGFAESFLVSNWFSPWAEQPFVADINGDGKADLITFTKGDLADVWVALSTGNGVGLVAKVSDWFAPKNEKPFVADVNGDGKADLITFVGGSGGQVYTALSRAQ